MTLIVTLATNKFVAQASDRRFTDLNDPSGEPFTDDANKAVLLDCQDAVFTFAYTGLGFVGLKRTDDWLVDLLLKVNATQLTAAQVVEAVTGAATEAFRRRSVNSEARLTLAAGVWPLVRGGRPLVGYISNFEAWAPTADGLSVRSRVHDRAQRAFQPHFLGCKAHVRNAAIVAASGREEAVTHTDKRLRRLRQYAVKNPEPDKITRKLVAFIRQCADHQSDGKYIGRNCMAVYVSDEVRTATYFPDDHSRPVSFAPHLVTGPMAIKDFISVGDKEHLLQPAEVERWKRLGKRGQPKWLDQ